MPGTRRQSGGNGNGSATESSAPAPVPVPGTAAAAGLPPVTSAPRGEDSLSATLERLRLNAQAAKTAASSGNAPSSPGGAAGHASSTPGGGQAAGGGYAAAARRSASGVAAGTTAGVGAGNNNAGGQPAPGSRLGRAAAAAAAQQAARGQAPGAGAMPVSVNAAAVPGGNTAAANETQMGNFVFDDELDAELHSEFNLLHVLFLRLPLACKMSHTSDRRCGKPRGVEACWYEEETTQPDRSSPVDEQEQ